MDNERIMGRISKPEYYLNIAKAVALRSTCIRRKYGAVIVKDDRIIATGYNGSARGERNCCDTGECWREMNNIPHGERYEECVAVHAEDNAISQAGRETIGETVEYVLAGIMRKEDAVERLRFEKINDQICFCTWI